MESIVQLATSSNSIVLITIVILALLYFLIARPEFAKRREHNLKETEVLVGLVRNNTEAMLMLKVITEDIRSKNDDHHDMTKNQYESILLKLDLLNDTSKNHLNLIMKKYDTIATCNSEVKELLKEMKIKQECKENNKHGLE